ncbi:MAG: hypothetical protein R2838_22610 [Caldilineaceae bacterium]
MLQRPTQTAAFWRDQFEVTAEDLDFLYDLLLDAQAPKSVKELAIALIDEYIRRENAKIEAELSKGAMYMPKETYTVGQTLVFPALDFAVAEVTDVRAGQNPEHGEFQVIAVTFADGAAREFAAGLTTPHRLNQTNGGNLLDDDALLSAEEIYEVYQEDIDETVLYALEEGDRSSASCR